MSNPTAPATVDASGLVAQTMARYRGTIEDVLRTVTGDPVAVARAEARYRDGASASARAQAEVAGLSATVAQNWSGPASTRYGLASEALAGGILSPAKATLAVQADAMGKVAAALQRASAGVEETLGGLDAAERSLVAAARGMSQADVETLLARARDAGERYQAAAVDHRNGLATVLAEQAARLRATAGPGAQGRVADIYQSAVDSFFDADPKGATRRFIKTKAVDQSDSSIYVYRLFIPDKTVSVPGGRLLKPFGIEPGARGDARGFTPDPTRTSRVAIAYRPYDGMVTATVYDTHSLDGTAHDPLPITDRNLQVWSERRGDLGISYSITNSMNPRTSPSVDGDVRLLIDKVSQGSADRNVRLLVDGDDFPNMEAYRYRQDGQVDPLGSASYDRRYGPLSLAYPDDDRQLEFLNGQPRTRKTSVLLIPDEFGRTMEHHQTIPVRPR